MTKALCKFFTRYKQNKSGATGVEFALVALPFIFMIFGTMEAGRAIWMMNGVQYAVEETSRYASINSTLSDESLEEYAATKLSGMFLPTDTLEITSSQITSDGIQFVEIDANYTLSMMVSGLLPGDFGNFDLDTTIRKPLIN